MKILLFKTNIDISKDKEKVAALLDIEKKVMNWSLENEDEFTVLLIMCSGLTENQIETIVSSIGFACVFWDE